MNDPLKRGVSRTPSVHSPDRPGTGLLSIRAFTPVFAGYAAGGSSPPGFTGT
ncbi:MAG: hypothetical protein QOD56_1111 [Gammaproteobacteria bacterium]|jgi:hypothetical protein|nr:hypothetical protein [Gammaproteobacteria bacterium]